MRTVTIKLPMEEALLFERLFTYPEVCARLAITLYENEPYRAAWRAEDTFRGIACQIRSQIMGRHGK